MAPVYAITPVWATARADPELCSLKRVSAFLRVLPCPLRHVPSGPCHGPRRPSHADSGSLSHLTQPIRVTTLGLSESPHSAYPSHYTQPIRVTTIGLSQSPHSGYPTRHTQTIRVTTPSLSESPYSGYPSHHTQAIRVTTLRLSESPHSGYPSHHTRLSESPHSSAARRPLARPHAAPRPVTAAVRVCVCGRGRRPEGWRGRIRGR